MDTNSYYVPKSIAGNIYIYIFPIKIACELTEKHQEIQTCLLCK